MRKIKTIFLVLIILGLTTSVFITTNPVKAQNTLKLGALGPLAITTGIDMQRGFELAVEEINNAGGVDIGGTKYTIEKFIETTSGSDGLPNPSTGQNSLSKLIDDDGVFAIVGGFRTEVVIALQNTLNTSKTPFFNIGSTAPLLTPYIYRVGPSNGTQLLRSLLELYGFYLKNLGVQNVTIVREEAAWSLRLSNFLKAYLKVGGLLNRNLTLNTDDIIIPTSYSLDQVETAITPMQGSEYNALLTLFSAPVGKFVTQAWASLNLDQYLAGINVESQRTDFFAETEGAAYGEIELETLPPDITPNQQTTDFREAYEEKYGVGPTYTAIASYNSVYVIKDGLERADSLDVAAFQTALLETDLDLPGYKVKFTNEIGPQYYYNSTGDSVPVENYDPTVVSWRVQDLYTPATVGVRSNGYIQGYFAQWQKDGVKKTVYNDQPPNFSPGNLTKLAEILVKAPINHSDFGTIPTTATSPSFEIPMTLFLFGSLGVIVNVIRKRKR